MYRKIVSGIFILTVSLFFTACTSVKQHNANREQPIPVSKLQEDINYVERKLHRLHPNLDLYLTKEQLAHKFDSIRSVVNKPMTSMEFYLVISPVVAAVRQGHMGMVPMPKRLTAKETKRLEKAGDGPLSQFKTEWLNGKLYILKNNSKVKEILPGTEVISIKGIKPQDLHTKYKNTYTSDGYNTTYLGKAFNKRFQSYITGEIGINDSLTFVLKRNDSVFTETIHRKKTDKKQTAKTGIDPKQLAQYKARQKKAARNKRIFGYDSKTKEYTRSLHFIGKDSTVAYLKINGFSDGNFRKAYKIIFDTLRKKQTTQLILDLRDNPGGRISDIMNLYSYLTPNDYIMTEPAVLTSKTSLWQSRMFSKMPKVTYPFLGIGYPFYMGVTYFKTTKGNDGKYYMKINTSKKQQHNPNHFQGKLYVLINGGSFSASCIISSALKTDKNVTFVGEETGGDFNGTVAGIMPVFRLPHSKISWRVGLMGIEPVNKTPVKGHGIYPDKEILPTIEDKVKGKDPELAWILKEIYK